jgi:alkylation response protein AidB-like acyl-CoA dehydrogenase
MLDTDEKTVVEVALRRFTAQVNRTLFTSEGPDGDLTRIPSLLSAARQMGLVADPAPAASGYELGIWGHGCREEGLMRSLLALSLLGEACAGFATAVHAQGLACLALDAQSQFLPGTPLAAVFTPHYGIPLSARIPASATGLELSTVGGALRLNGTAHFLLAAELPQMLVCFAQRPEGNGTEPEWCSLVVDANAAGIELTEVSRMDRVGLRAVRQYHLRCGQVSIRHAALLRKGAAAWRTLAQVLACDWLGHAAIALGIARCALRESRAYTAQRYQGGRLIQEHASIQLLQGTAEYDIALQEAVLFQHAGQPLAEQDAAHLLRWALQARLAVVEHAHRAVTNCLQTLGGYGYMEDYRFEKRLRDVSTLKSLHGAPDQLKLYLNELANGAG